MKGLIAGLERFRHGRTGVSFPGRRSGAAVRAYLWRDSGAGSAPHPNRFPAAPFCTLTWFLSGTVHDGVSAAARVLPAVVVGGPFTRPATTFSAGRVHAFTIVFYPDAFARLAGVDPAALADRLVPADAVLPDAWHPLLREVAGATDDRNRIACVETFLARHVADAGGTRGWLSRLCDAAGVGRLGERQVERNIRRATGQTLRTLRCAERFEAAILGARAAAAGGRVDWAGLACENAYSDQPHLGRECRRFAGASPAELLARVDDDESYWLYRHWR
ncbi:DUF6597 domain-containing transcriptional factor [Massilia sp. METH4]|uniref:DUF6597 domain-containing transcriptional factor n=1 Tax=Massilia sp. METH4 TaxID=3123041 RepID=UPI0030CC1948